MIVEYSQISALGPEGYCTSCFRSVMCISCRWHVEFCGHPHGGVSLMWTEGVGKAPAFLVDLINWWTLSLFSTEARPSVNALEAFWWWIYNYFMVATVCYLDCQADCLETTHLCFVGGDNSLCMVFMQVFVSECNGYCAFTRHLFWPQ